MDTFQEIKRDIVNMFTRDETTDAPTYEEVASVVWRLVGNLRENADNLPATTSLVCVMALDLLQATNVQNNFTASVEDQLNHYRNVSNRRAYATRIMDVE